MVMSSTEIQVVDPIIHHYNLYRFKITYGILQNICR